jgi:IS30 family transposase
VTRELRRNICSDGAYRPATADDFARWRRARSRRNQRFVAKDWALVLSFLKQQWSPEQISGRPKRDGGLRISHESIYRYIWQDKRRGGTRYKLLRQAGKKSRKRYDAYDSRGRLAGKRHISERPAAAQGRTLVGHWEIDTVVGPGRPCIVTLVERVTGTEFHGYKDLEAATGALFYFATPHHSWERGTSENTNGLIRQYIPKRTSMSRLSQLDCDRIAHKLNHRPRRRLGFRTPAECYELTSAT